MIAIFLIALLVQSQSQSKSNFDFFGISQFKFGMSEEEVIKILKANNKYYKLELETRKKSKIAVPGFSKDNRVLLDGKLSIVFDFEGNDLFANDRKLKSTTLLWDDWSTFDDRHDGYVKMVDGINRLLGESAQVRVGSYYFPEWKNSKGYLYAVSNSKGLGLWYSAKRWESETIASDDENTESDEDTPPRDFVPVEKSPEYIKQVEPQYPDLAKRAGLDGTVWVKIWVDKEGRPRKAVVIKSDAEIFNQPAIEAAMQWIFTPAMMKTGPVAVWVSVPFRFKLPTK